MARRNGRGRAFENRIFNIALVTVTLGAITTVLALSNHEGSPAPGTDDPVAATDLVRSINATLTGPGGCLNHSQLDNNRTGQPARIVGDEADFSIVPADPSATAVRMRHAGGVFLVFASSAETVNGRYECGLTVIPDEAHAAS